MDCERLVILHRLHVKICSLRPSNPQSSRLGASSLQLAFCASSLDVDAGYRAS